MPEQVTTRYHCDKCGATFEVTRAADIDIWTSVKLLTDKHHELSPDCDPHAGHVRFAPKEEQNA